MDRGDDPSGEGEPARRARISYAYWMQTAADYALDLIFPPSCVGCGRVGQSWCGRCQRATESLEPIFHLAHGAALTAAAATAPHEGRLREAVQALKYENVRTLALFMAERMARCLRQLEWTYDMVLPVPISSARLRERRYNQAGLIAAALAQEVGVAVQPNFIWRTRETRSQVGLTAEERQQNVADAFAAHPDLLRQHSILLIDDVYTTGATLQACAEALRAVSAQEVFALTVTAAHHQ